MPATPNKIFLFAALFVAAGLAVFVATRRPPACGGDGKIMSTQKECASWGFDAETCKTAIEKARAIAVRAAPRVGDATKCETDYPDCFQGPDGGFYPRPSFCLRETDKSAEPVDLHYLVYESDRMSRKTTREVPIK